MGKDFLWLAGLGVVGFIAYEYFQSQLAAVASASSSSVPVTSGTVSTVGGSSNAGGVVNVNGNYVVVPQLTQADVNAIINMVRNNWGFKVDPNGNQLAEAAQWWLAYVNVTNSNFNPTNLSNAFYNSTQLMTWQQFWSVVSQVYGLSGLGAIGKLRNWNNSIPSRYELIAAQFPRG